MNLSAVFDVPSLLPQEVVWGLVPRAIGLLYFIAFASLGVQALALVGNDSPSPARAKLESYRGVYRAWTRFRLYPTLLWLNDSDAMLRGLMLCGLLCGAAAVVGGPWTPLLFVVAYACYLSLDSGGLSFPWDQLLLEAGILGALLPAPLLLPQVAAASLPLPLTAFAVHFLIARLMLGFAKVKFIGAKKSDALYLKTFYVWMPMPNPLGLLAFRLPKTFHRLSLTFMFVAEVICPILILFPGWPRVVGAVGLVALMVGIHATGNWGFFNVGYVLLCVSLLDTSTSLAAFDFATSTTSLGVIAHQLAVLGLVSLGALWLLALNSWVSRSWTFWPLIAKLSDRSSMLRLVFAIFRQISVLRVANAYGVFPAQISPAVRLTPIFEGSDDGKTWKRYRYRFMPSAADHAPPLIAPHHPRFDQSIAYITGGFSDESLITSLTGAGTPTTAYQRDGLPTAMLHLLLSDAEKARRFFAQVPTFEDDTPKFARIRTIALTAAPPEDAAPWRERSVGILLEALSRQDVEGGLSPTHPENIHPDFVFWKERALPLQAMVKAARTLSLREALVAESDLSAADVERFFSVAIPWWNQALLEHDREHRPVGDADNVAFAVNFQNAGAYAERFSIEERIAHERLLDRAAWLLRDRLLPHLWRGQAPVVERQPAFRTHMVLQALVLRGEDALVAALADPASVVSAFRTPSDAAEKEAFFLRHIALLTLIRRRHVLYTVRVFRWNAIGGGFLTGDRLPSVLEYYPMLAAIVPPGEDWRPTFVPDADGYPQVAEHFAASSGADAVA